VLAIDELVTLLTMSVAPWVVLGVTPVLLV
jgi:hypothetical protein